MKSPLYRAALAVMFALPIASISAQVIDQSNTANPTTFFFSTDWNGQTFKPLATTSAGAGFFLDNVANASVSGNMKVELWTAVPTAVGSQMIASGITSFLMPAFAKNYVDVFWGAVGVVPNTTYFLAMKAFGPSMTLHAMATSSSAYTRGGVYYSFASAPTSTGVTWTNYSTSNYDYAFREFATGPTVPAVVATPEPASVALLATGLMFVAAARVRRAPPKQAS